ncbi:hypothetical protein ABZP36_021659 [Zizania latifolia]
MSRCSAPCPGALGSTYLLRRYVVSPRCASGRSEPALPNWVVTRPPFDGMRRSSTTGMLRHAGALGPSSRGR